MPMTKLPQLTKKCLKIVQESEFSKGFVLIGGTALSIAIEHRVSEDIDLAFLGENLPKKRIDTFIQELGKFGLKATKSIDVAAQEDFIDAGLDLDDSQQDYLVVESVNGIEHVIKLSFVRFDNTVSSCLKGNKDSDFRIADLTEIFSTKAIACANRSKSRDWLDLYVMMNSNEFNFFDFHNVFARIGNSLGFDIASENLSNAKPGPNDEGYLHLMENPPTLDEIRSFFTEGFAEYRSFTGLKSVFKHQ